MTYCFFSKLVATIDWGDGNTSQGTVDPDGSGGFIVIGSDTFANSGNVKGVGSQ